MRVFETFKFNLRSVKFKDNKPFFEFLLDDLGIKYQEVLFCFSGDFAYAKSNKVIKKFPALAEYKRHTEAGVLYPHSSEDFYLTSNHYRDNAIGGLAAQHREAFDQLLQSIPHYVCWPFMGVVLDGVDWYGDNKQTPAFLKEREQTDFDLYNHSYSNYFSNSIRFFKEFDYGNKLNLVQIIIDRTAEDALRPYPDGFQTMIQQLGKPIQQQLICTFDRGEREKQQQAKEAVCKVIAEFQKTVDFAIAAQKDPDWIEPIKGFSPKALFTRLAKRYGYSYHSFGQGEYKFIKVSPNHYSYIVELVVPPFTSFLFGGISVKGYNFEHHLFSGDQIVIQDPSDAEKYSAKIFETAISAEQFEQVLLEGYGKTPSWFV